MTATLGHHTNRSRLVEIYAPSYAKQGSSPFSGSLHSSPGRPSQQKNGSIKSPASNSNTRLLEELRRQVKAAREENQALHGKVKKLEDEKERRVKGGRSAKGPALGTTPVPAVRRDIQLTIQQLTQENRILRDRIRNFRADLRRLCNDFNGMASKQLLALMKSLDTSPSDPVGVAKDESWTQHILLLKEAEIRNLKSDIRRLSLELEKRPAAHDSPSRIPRAASTTRSHLPPCPVPRKTLPSTSTSKLPKPSRNHTTPPQSPIKNNTFLAKDIPTKYIINRKRSQSPSKLTPARELEPLCLLQAAIRAHLTRKTCLLHEVEPELRVIQAALRAHASRKSFVRNISIENISGD